MRFWTKYKLKRQGLTGKKSRKKNAEGRFRGALEKSGFVKALIGVSTCVGIIGIILIGQEPSRETIDLYVGQPAPVDVFADTGFSYTNMEETEKLRREAAEKVLPRYSFSKDKLTDYALEIEEFLVPLGKGEVKDTEGERGQTAKAERGGRPVITEMDPRDLEVLRKAKKPGELAEKIRSFLLSLAGPEAPKMDEVERSAAQAGADKAGERYRLALITVAEERMSEWIPLSLPRDRGLRESVENIVRVFCSRSIDYDEELTGGIKAVAEARIKSVVSIVQPGRKIIEKGYEVTPQQMEVYSAYISRREALSPAPMKMRQRLYYILGLALLIMMFLIVTRRYLRQYQKPIYKSNSSLFMLELIILVALLLSRAITLIPFGSIQSAWNNIFYYLIVFSVPMAAILMTLLLNKRLALFFVVLIGIILGIIKGFNLSYTIVSSIGGIVAIYSTIGVRRRAQLIKAGATIALANIITIGAIDAIDNLNIISATVGLRVAGGFVAGMFSAFVAASLLPLFEYVFNVVTDISFLELSDLNHPLLKRLFIEAPGTYHHSLMVGNLSEAAAEAVGANPLQVRVCAYFHDIGKLKKPEYFMENELYGKSKHDELNPRMSGLIIGSHVKDGVDMAVKHKLNHAIIDAITQHHGKGLMYFFYHRAEEAKAKGEDVAQEDFRYLGPKPQSKETAILLLADAVEAASRSLDRPTPSRVRNLVRKVINQRIIDGQLDECDLTFRDLHRISERFEHILNGTFHTRVKYPEKEIPGKPDEGFNKKPGKKKQD